MSLEEPTTQDWQGYEEFLREEGCEFEETVSLPIFGAVVVVVLGISVGVVVGVVMLIGKFIE